MCVHSSSSTKLLWNGSGRKMHFDYVDLVALLAHLKKKLQDKRCILPTTGYLRKMQGFKPVHSKRSLCSAPHAFPVSLSTLNQRHGAHAHKHIWSDPKWFIAIKYNVQCGVKENSVSTRRHTLQYCDRKQLEYSWNQVNKQIEGSLGRDHSGS